MTKKSQKSFVNFKHHTTTKTLVIDLGDSIDLTKIIINSKQLGKPVILPLASLLSNTDQNLIPNEQDQNSQTNSGIIKKTQFNDGGFGDIGQQWSRVRLHDSTIINNHTSISLTLNRRNGKVHFDNNNFASDNVASGHKNKLKEKKH